MVIVLADDDDYDDGVSDDSVRLVLAYLMRMPAKTQIHHVDGDDGGLRE